MAPALPPEGSRRLPRHRWPAASGQAAEDLVAVEEPMGLRVQGADYAVLMRTPGRDEDLACGFLAAEGVLAGPEDLGAVAPCVVEEGVAINVALAPGVPFDGGRVQPRRVDSSCGLCGAHSIADLERMAPRALPPAPERMDLEVLQRAFGALRAGQELFAATAGSHGAGLVDAEGRLLDLAEDVGRHNAVDKLLGACLRAGDYPLAGGAGLVVSGRLSYELVQKAVLGGLAWLAGVGMPTTLAVEAAAATGRGLYGWVRDGGVSVYAGGTVFDGG
jgi:FdhD protein